MTLDPNKVRHNLLEKRKELQVINTTFAEKEITLDQQVLGNISRMDALQQRALARAAESRRQFEIKSIEAALRRIDEEEYGYCGRCGAEISERRLQVNPCAAYCIECAD
ncbi:MAG: TraR/DksA family transcriptional regulator [Pseudomonadota bacterium]